MQGLCGVFVGFEQGSVGFVSSLCEVCVGFVLRMLLSLCWLPGFTQSTCSKKRLLQKRAVSLGWFCGRLVMTRVCDVSPHANNPLSGF